MEPFQASGSITPCVATGRPNSQIFRFNMNEVMFEISKLGGGDPQRFLELLDEKFLKQQFDDHENVEPDVSPDPAPAPAPTKPKQKVAEFPLRIFALDKCFDRFLKSVAQRHDMSRFKGLRRSRVAWIRKLEEMEEAARKLMEEEAVGKEKE